MIVAIKVRVYILFAECMITKSNKINTNRKNIFGIMLRNSLDLTSIFAICYNKINVIVSYKFR